jgi:hypothetical protein
MAISDQQTKSPDPVWIFLWSFGLITVCFLAAHHWHYKTKSVQREKYAPILKTYDVKAASGPVKSYKKLKNLEGGILLADE